MPDFFVRYNGSEITLRDVQPKDEGEYACQLNRIDTPIELVHHLDVLSKLSTKTLIDTMAAIMFGVKVNNVSM